MNKTEIKNMAKAFEVKPATINALLANGVPDAKIDEVLDIVEANLTDFNPGMTTIGSNVNARISVKNIIGLYSASHDNIDRFEQLAETVGRNASRVDTRSTRARRARFNIAAENLLKGKTP